MDWFGLQLSKDPAAAKSAVFGPQAILQELSKRAPQYLDDVDQGRLIYPACKRTSSDAHGDVGSILNHTRLEAVRYVSMVPRASSNRWPSQRVSPTCWRPIFASG